MLDPENRGFELLSLSMRAEGCDRARTASHRPDHFSRDRLRGPTEDSPVEPGSEPFVDRLAQRRTTGRKDLWRPRRATSRIAALASSATPAVNAAPMPASLQSKPPDGRVTAEALRASSIAMKPLASVRAPSCAVWAGESASPRSRSTRYLVMAR